MKEWAAARQRVQDMKSTDQKAAEKLNKEITIRYGWKKHSFSQDFFPPKILENISPFFGVIDTPGLGFHCFHSIDSSDSPRVQHLLTSWWQEWQPSLFFGPRTCTSRLKFGLNVLNVNGRRNMGKNKFSLLNLNWKKRLKWTFFRLEKYILKNQSWARGW